MARTIGNHLPPDFPKTSLSVWSGPGPTELDLRDHVLGDAKLGPEFPLKNETAGGANFGDLLGGEFRDRVLDAVPPRCPPPGGPVPVVVTTGARFKMKRVAARGVVALMANTEPPPDGAKSNFEGYAVCVVPATTVVEAAVPELTFPRAPWPANILGADVDIRPKSSNRSPVHGLKVVEA